MLWRASSTEVYLRGTNTRELRLKGNHNAMQGTIPDAGRAGPLTNKCSDRSIGSELSHLFRKL